MPLVYRAVLGTLGPVLRLAGRVQAVGKSRVPDGGAVFAFNHPRNVDPVNVVVAWGDVLYFLGKREVFDLPLLGYILRGPGGQIPLDRTRGNNVAAIEEAVMHLRVGHKVALAPEGTRQRGKGLGRGRTGAARLALSAAVPLVPVAIRYGPGPLGPCRVEFGEPVDLSPWRGRAEDPEACRVATDRLMVVLARMLGQDDYDPATAPDYAAARGFRMRPDPENLPES